MLQTECARARATIRLDQHIGDIQSLDTGFVVEENFFKITTGSVVIATGGLSIPKIGAAGFGYQIAQKFGLAVVPPRPGLVPLTFDAEMLTRCKSLFGLSVEATIHCQRTEFSEGLLFTHRGLSGQSILQISSYWHDGMPLTINLVPGTDIAAALKGWKRQNPRQDVVTCLSHYLPKRLAADICMQAGMDSQLTTHNDNRLGQLGVAVNRWQLLPVGTEGYRTAEVTLGGVDTGDLLSSTMRAKRARLVFYWRGCRCNRPSGRL